MPNEHPDPDQSDGVEAAPSGPVTSTQPAEPLAPETAEAIPEMKLTVAGSCENPNGLYVGLSQYHREKLGLGPKKEGIGKTVELVDADGKSLGVFTVGAGSSKLLGTPELFTANGIATGTTVTVRARRNPPEKPMEYNVQHSMENGDEEKTERRRDIIKNRLQMDPDVFVAIPTPLAAQIGITPKPGERIASISKGKIKVDGVEHEVAIVPTGSVIGFTSKAAEILKVPPQLERISITVENGMLVIS